MNLATVAGSTVLVRVYLEFDQIVFFCFLKTEFRKLSHTVLARYIILKVELQVPLQNKLFDQYATGTYVEKSLECIGAACL